MMGRSDLIGEARRVRVGRVCVKVTGAREVLDTVSLVTARWRPEQVLWDSVEE